jgi:hypothetical protein
MIGMLHVARAGSVAGVGFTALGAVSHDQLMSWGGVALAGLSALATFGWSQYHAWRENRRKEDADDRDAARKQDAADRLAETDALRDQIRVQIELEAKVQANAERLELFDRALRELADEMERWKAIGCLNAPECPRRSRAGAAPP